MKSGSGSGREVLISSSSRQGADSMRGDAKKPDDAQIVTL